MAVLIESSHAAALVQAADLHESVIGGFWQDLVSLGQWDDERDGDELAEDLFELAESSGLRWPTQVPRVLWNRQSKRVSLSCSAEQAIELLQLYTDVRTGRWASVADVAERSVEGSLDPKVKRSLAQLRRRMQLTDRHDPDVQAILDIIDRLRLLT